MSTIDDSTTTAPPARIEVLFAEAERQLTICNACRYCEGYSAVFPALERRTQLSQADITQLANLCHDCRACLYACMYAPPHEFAINPPRILSEVRSATWDKGATGEAPAPSTSRHGSGAAGLAFLATGGIVVAISAATTSISRLWSGGGGDRSPYSVIAYPSLIVMMLVAFGWACLVMGRAGVRQWRLTRGSLGDLFALRAWNHAIAEAGQLRYLKGGGADCQYPTVTHTPIRRYLHGVVAYGFTLCLVSTIAAGIEQDIAGVHPPYSWVSVPVITGFVGGIGLVVGSLALASIKARTDPLPTDEQMVVRDYSLLAVLTLLGMTGLLTLLLRTTPAYGTVLTIHLATVATAFLIAPYTKFNHVLYRMLALVQDNIERSEPNDGVL